MKPKFIVFEGLDGSGTSTQAHLLEQKLTLCGQNVLLTTEPSNGPIGLLIRQAFKGRIKFQADGAKFDEQMAYLFAADRHDHLYNDIDGIIPMMNKNFNIVSTRYYFSSFAYHCTSDQSWDLVHRLNKAFPAPDLVIYLQNSVDESIKRLSRRPHLDSYEEENKLTMVAKNYEKIMADYQGDKLIIDASRKKEDIHALITSKLGLTHG